MHALILNPLVILKGGLSGGEAPLRIIKIFVFVVGVVGVVLNS